MEANRVSQRKKAGGISRRSQTSSENSSDDYDSESVTSSTFQAPVVSGVCMVVSILAVLVVVTFTVELAVYRYQLASPQRQKEEAERMALEAQVERLVQERMYEFRSPGIRSFDDLGMTKGESEEEAEKQHAESEELEEEELADSNAIEEPSASVSNGAKEEGEDTADKEVENATDNEGENHTHNPDFIEVFEELYTPRPRDNEVERNSKPEVIEAESLIDMEDEECEICEEECSQELFFDDPEPEEAVIDEVNIPQAVEIEEPEEEPADKTVDAGTQTEHSRSNETSENKFTMNSHGPGMPTSMISKLFSWTTNDKPPGCRGDVLRVGESLQAGKTLHNGCPSSELLVNSKLRKCTPAFLHLTQEGVIIVGEGDNFEEMIAERWRIDPNKNSKKKWKSLLSLMNLNFMKKNEVQLDAELVSEDLDEVEVEEVSIQKKIIAKIKDFFSLSSEENTSKVENGLNLHLQNDGALVLQDSHGTALWTSMRNVEENSGDYIARVDDFGHLIVTLDHSIHWADQYKPALANYFQPKLDAIQYC